VCRASRMLFGTDRPLRMPVSGRECRLVCCITGLLIDLSNGIAGSMCSKVRVSERSCANDTPLSALDDVSVPVSVLSAVFENLSRGGAATRKDGAASCSNSSCCGLSSPSRSLRVRSSRSLFSFLSRRIVKDWRYRDLLGLRSATWQTRSHARSLSTLGGAWSVRLRCAPCDPDTTW